MTEIEKDELRANKIIVVFLLSMLALAATVETKYPTDCVNIDECQDSQ